MTQQPTKKIHAVVTTLYPAEVNEYLRSGTKGNERLEVNIIFEHEKKESFLTLQLEVISGSLMKDGTHVYAVFVNGYPGEDNAKLASLTLKFLAVTLPYQAQLEI